MKIFTIVIKSISQQKKEAIKQAKKEKEFTKELITVNKLIWDAEEEKYCYQYENGALIPSILEI